MTPDASFEAGRRASAPRFTARVKALQDWQTSPAGLVVREWRWSAIAATAVAIALGIATVQFVWAAARALALVVLAAALAAALAPVVEQLSRRMSRTVAVTLVYAGGAAALVLVGWFTMPRLGTELQELAQSSSKLTSAVQQQFQAWIPDAVALQRIVEALAGRFASLIQQVPVQVASLFFNILVVVFLSMYFLTISSRLHWFFVSLFPHHRRRHVSLVVCRMGRTMGGYFRGVAIDAAIIGTLTWIALVALGVEFALPLAVMAAFGEFVPYIGPIVAAVPAIAVGLLQSPQQAFFVALVYVALQQLEGHIITPNVMRTQTDISPASVIVALTVGFTVGGLLGAIAAIPIFAAARVLVTRVLAPALRKAGRNTPSPQRARS